MHKGCVQQHRVTAIHKRILFHPTIFHIKAIARLVLHLYRVSSALPLISNLNFSSTSLNYPYFLEHITKQLLTYFLILPCIPNSFTNYSCSKHNHHPKQYCYLLLHYSYSKFPLPIFCNQMILTLISV